MNVYFHTGNFFIITDKSHACIKKLTITYLLGNLECCIQVFDDRGFLLDNWCRSSDVFLGHTLSCILTTYSILKLNYLISQCFGDEEKRLTLSAHKSIFCYASMSFYSNQTNIVPYMHENLSTFMTVKFILEENYRKWYLI